MFNLTRTHKLSFFILIEILLIYLLYILRVTPGASGYEASIYAAYPTTFWVIYFLIYLFSLSALLYSIFIKSDKLFLYPGLFNLLILNLIILLLPLFRSYFTVSMGDIGAHLRYINGILSTQHFGALTTVENPYPLTHVLSANIMLIAQTKLETVGQVTPVLYYVVYILFTYLLGRELFDNNRKSMLLLLVALVPILHGYSYYPSRTFLFLIPMLLYVLAKNIKDDSIPSRLMVLILLIALPFIHPASSMLFILLFIVIYLVVLISRARNFTLRSYQTTPLIFLTVWLLWTISLEGHFAGWIRYYIDWFSNIPEQYSYFKENVAGLEAAQLTPVNTIILYIKKFGPMHLLFGLASTFSIYSIYNWIKKKKYDRINIALSLICLVYVALYIISFFFTLTLLGARLHPYTLLISVLVSAVFLFNLVNASKTKIIKVASLTLVTILLFSATYVATFNYYESPFNKNPPEHCTYMELNGMDWLLQTRNKDLEVEDQSHYQIKVAKYLWGFEEVPGENRRGLKGLGDPYTIPHHFNYDNGSLLAKYFQKNMYLFINKKTELIAANVFPEYEDRWVFHPDDYEKLESDKSIDKMYHNGEIKIFYVNGEKWRKDS